jgi:hypothetical protein
MYAESAEIAELLEIQSLLVAPPQLILKVPVRLSIPEIVPEAVALAVHAAVVLSVLVVVAVVVVVSLEHDPMIAAMPPIIAIQINSFFIIHLFQFEKWQRSTFHSAGITFRPPFHVAEMPLRAFRISCRLPNPQQSGSASGQH